MEEKQVYSSVDQLEEFKTSVIWADFRNEMLVWKESYERDLRAVPDVAAAEGHSTATILLHLGELNGYLKAVEYILLLPDTLINDKVKEVSEE